MNGSGITMTLLAISLLSGLAGCSKVPARSNPCELVSVNEAQAIDSGIAKSQWFPRKKGEANELCVFLDANGEGRLMLFLFDDKAADPLAAVKSGMKGADDKVVEVSGVGEKAAAGFDADGGALKLFAARSRSGMIGIRVREPVKETDESFNDVKSMAAAALRRIK